MQEKVKSAFSSKLEELFGIDLRSLAIFRVGLGLIILGDLIHRSFDLRAFYTDSGVLPRAALLEKPPAFWEYSLHLISGSAPFQACLFILTGLFALALIFGYRTRLANFACWLLITSLYFRNPLILQSGDILLHLYLFWGLFLPLGACYSMDRALDSSQQILPRRVLSGGSIALLLQICFVYLFAGINKTGNSWRDGSALYYLFNLDALTTPFGHSLLGHPGLLKFLTHFTLWLERLGPLVAFVPIFTRFFRTLIVFLFIGLHLGMALCLNLGPFPYISILGWVVFLPSGFWDKVLKPKNLPKLSSIKSHRLTNVLAFFLIGYVLLWNLASMNTEKYRPVFIRKYKWVGDLLSLTQAWGMFAPGPSEEGGWHVIPGRLWDGSEVDLFRGGKPLHWEKPSWVASTISNVRWRKYLDWITFKSNADYRRYYGRYLCQEWNSHHPAEKKVKALRIYFIREKTLPNDQKSEPKKDLLWEQDCLIPSDSPS